MLYFLISALQVRIRRQKMFVYDFRTNMHFTLKQNPMTDQDLEDFILCYNPKNRYERKETYSEQNPKMHWRALKS